MKTKDLIEVLQILQKYGYDTVNQQDDYSEFSFLLPTGIVFSDEDQKRLDELMVDKVVGVYDHLDIYHLPF